MSDLADITISPTPATTTSGKDKLVHDMTTSPSQTTGLPAAENLTQFTSVCFQEGDDTSAPQATPASEDNTNIPSSTSSAPDQEELIKLEVDNVVEEKKEGDENSGAEVTSALTDFDDYVNLKITSLSTPEDESNEQNENGREHGHKYYPEAETNESSCKHLNPGDTGDQAGGAAGTGEVGSRGPSASNDGKMPLENDNPSGEKTWSWRQSRPGGNQSGKKTWWRSFWKQDSVIQVEGLPERFSYKQLKAVTGNFSNESKLLGKGFGDVYRGVLPSSGIPVTVKKFDDDSTPALEEFWTEIFIASRLKHPNLIRLLGWCEDRKKHLLVYDLMPKGTLADLLFRPAKVGMTCLSWRRRFKILTDTAAALCYLHQGSEQIVVHGDVNSANIMLNEEWNAKLGNFGIACLVDPQLEGKQIDLQGGTVGYICPEYFERYVVTDKTDVFAFGVVVFEVACGQRPMSDNSEPGQRYLVRRVWNSYRDGELLSMVDKRLGLNYDQNLMETVLAVGLLCTHSDPLLRPSMRSVVQMLAGDVQVPSLPFDESYRRVPSMFQRA
ncbi:unnamed protein product [Calypogeia fissa]